MIKNRKLITPSILDQVEKKLKVFSWAKWAKENKVSYTALMRARHGITTYITPDYEAALKKLKIKF